MWVVFLDFDGVLVNSQFLKSIIAAKRSTIGQLDPVAVARLNRLCDATGARVVVSSSWRYGRTLSQLRDVLTGHGFTGTVVGATPKMSSAPRGEEIQAWLDAAADYNHEVTRFVIIDDNADMLHLSDRLVETSPDVGLQDADVDKAIGLLRQEPSSIIVPDRRFVARFLDEG